MSIFIPDFDNKIVDTIVRDEITNLEYKEKFVTGMILEAFEEIAGVDVDIRISHKHYYNLLCIATFATVGTIEVGPLTADLSDAARRTMPSRVPVTINKLVLDYDQLVVCGPTFPHEVAGFSGGNKYFFPGISSQ